MVAARTPAVNWRVGRRALYLFFAGNLNESLPPVHQVLRVLKAEHQPLIVLDLTEAESADSRALEWIEQFIAKAEAAQHRTRIVACRGSRIRRTLELLGFSRFVLVVDNLRQAVRSPGS